MGEWNCLVNVAESLDEFRGKVEGGTYDLVLAGDTDSLRRLIGEVDPKGDILTISLAEIERRHILRVLSACDDNKTHAAKILRIDTKTLYNKLKSYAPPDQTVARRSLTKPRASKTG